MIFKDKALWDQAVEANQDEYGKAIYSFAERWADLMEVCIEEGKSIEDFAEQTKCNADTECISGHMYAMAVSLLSTAWIGGETLRQWHNLDTQLHDEGEKANQGSGVLNPAIVNVKG